MDLNNSKKIILITGATSGIGEAAANLLSNKYNLILCGRRKERLSKIKNRLSKKTEVITLNFDVRSKEDVTDKINSLPDKWKKINILINNAGITKDNLFLRMTEDDWAEVIDTNLNSVFRMTKLVVRGMLKKKWGRIINISSISGSMGNPGQTNYSASKAGVEAFSRSLAKELGSRNITVNSVAPGFIQTDMTQGLIDEEITKKIPLQRVGSVEDVASLINFLVSEESNYITGQTLVVDGGLFMK